MEWRPHQEGFSSHVEGPHLLCGPARGGSEHAQYLPELAAWRQQETQVHRLPPSQHQDQALPLGR
ncbi:hypothetical protein LEMLEM_LOCUS20060 [Lemmus lemmus]